MAQSVRIEYISLSEKGNSRHENILRGTDNVPVGQTLTVSNTATASGSRPVVPAPAANYIASAANNQAVRLVAITNPVYVTWGSNPTATLTNSIRLGTEIPEVIILPPGALLSFIAENP